MKLSRLVVAGTAGLLLVGALAWGGPTSAPISEAGRTAFERPSGTAPNAAGDLAQFSAVADRLARCRSLPTASAESCTGVVYVRSPLMPLSDRGIVEIQEATNRLGIDLAVIDASELEVRAARLFPAGGGGPASIPPSSAEDEIAAAMIAAGATVHFPSLLVYRAGSPLGSAILGFKTADAYRSMVQERLELTPTAFSDQSSPPARPPVDTLAWSVEYPLPGRPGAYFRAVQGRQTLAYEAGGTVYLLDLADSSRATAPGFIDFVPTPDGRYFVTPGDSPRGLEFYDAAQVFEAASRGAGARVNPIYVDRQLRDQYPSVGVLETARDGAGSRTVYRVLTSWFDGIVFRDYEVRVDGAGGRTTITPIADRVVACPRVSIPIISPGGREVAGRDETSATTKIFRLDSGACEEVEDVGLQTGKVAWTPDASRIAFAIPRGAVRDGTGTLWVGEDDAELTGIFVYDRSRRTTTRVEGSEDAFRLAFPEFVGADSLVYLVAPEQRGRSAFRLVCCVR